MLQACKYKEYSMAKYLSLLTFFQSNNPNIDFHFCFLLINQTTSCHCVFLQTTNIFCEDAELVFWFRHKKTLHRGSEDVFRLRIPVSVATKTRCPDILLKIAGVFALFGNCPKVSPRKNTNIQWFHTCNCWKDILNCGYWLACNFTTISPTPPSMNVRWWICNLNVIWHVL